MEVCDDKFHVITCGLLVPLVAWACGFRLHLVLI